MKQKPASGSGRRYLRGGGFAAAHGSPLPAEGPIKGGPDRRSFSEGGFFHPRILITLVIVLAGVFLALAGVGLFSATGQNLVQALQKYKIITTSTDPLVPQGFDCSTVYEKGLDKQENMRAGAIMIACGMAPGGSASTSATSTLGPIGQFFQRLFAPMAYGTGDVDLVNHSETSSHITQSETFSTANPDNPNQIVVAYNDSRGRFASPINMSGASVSTDGGLTFDRLTKANGQSPFDSTMGDPVILYNKATSTWFTVWLDAGCGAQGLGGYKSNTPEDPNSWTHYCVHTSSQDDRESGWADNNPSSPFYGRMYVSWNDFTRGSNVFVRYSTDNGNTWTDEQQVTTSFFRNIQMTGDVVTGDVYIAGMDEGGGGCGTTRSNTIYRSTNGGATWTNTYTGPPFIGPCRSASGYFATMYDNPPYWRHMGWGQPAAYNQVVHYAYSAANGTDPGNVYYIRSTDRGVTFSAPFQLNSNTDPTKAQWEPSLSVSPSGTLLATWYDEAPRTAASCQPSSPGTLCYQMHSRRSNDNGLTWLPDDTLSDVASPLPLQPDPGIASIYAGDYDYASATTAKHVTSWADGRVIISGASQQDAVTDAELVGFVVSGTNPACNSFINTQAVDFIINLTDSVKPGTVQGTDLTVNGMPADSFALSNDGGTITFTFNTSPITQQGPQTMHIPAGAFLDTPDGQPNLDFACTFNYALVQLQVTTTVPAVGGTFSPQAPQTYQYDVNWNIPVDPNSVQASDLSLNGIQGATVSSVTVINNAMTTSFMINVPSGGSLTVSVAPGAITDAFGNPNAAFTGNYTVDGCPTQYILTNGTDPIVPGTTDTGNHCDDCDTPVSLPFPFQFYGQTYTAVNVNSNGRLDFVSVNEPNGFNTGCLPAPPNQGPYDYTIFPLWHDMSTEVGSTACTAWANGCGIFTSVTGTAPNRVFNIEWHALRFYDQSPVNFEARLFENDLNQRFDIIFGAGTTITTSVTAGVQGPTGSVTQDFCNNAPPQNASRTYTIPFCGVPSPTPTATATATPTPTPTPTACPATAAPTALSATNISFGSFTANWSSVSGATSYRLDVSTSSAFTTYVPGYQNLDVGNVTSYNVTGLNPSTYYYYRVRSYNGCAPSSNSSSKRVLTLPCTPAAPSVGSATKMTFSGFRANWSSVSGAIDYRLDVSTSSSFTTYVPGYQDLHVGNVTGYPVTGLNPSTTYYYRVRSYNGCAASLNSSSKSVLTLPCTPAAPSAGSATNVTFSSFRANWSGVSGAIDYRVDVSTSSSFTSYVPGYQDLHVGNVTSYPVTGLNPSTTYYYRVRAYNGCAASANSSTKTVLTLVCIPAAPSARSASNVTATSFTAIWRTVSGSTDYRLDVARDSSFTTYVPGYQNLSVGTVLSYPVTGLSPSTLYYYRVRSYNGCAASANSSVISVTTLSQ